MSDTRKIVVDGAEVEVPAYYTLLQAAEAAGAEIPRFCFHERLSIAGNCRMCLIEVKGGPPKPAASCAMGVRDLRPGPEGEPPEIMTKSPMVKKAREGVMEFLLINHPLDCPICDQGGECDLQDQAMAYGVDASRFHENKRAVEDKHIGPLVKTIMTRCIHCTRCVRFTTEVAGVTEMGMTGRGEDAEITTYLEKALTSELQGNVIDLCPVGALTSKPYAFKARPWELIKTESVDVMDAVGSAIRVDSRGREVMRILPRLNEAVNEEWISDKTRYIFDGLRTQRLDRPYVRRNGKLEPVRWEEAFSAIAERLRGSGGDRVAAIAGDLASVEEMFALKSLMTAIGSPHMDCRQDGTALDPAHGRAGYLFNSRIAGIDEADAIMIIGANPRIEAPVLNARIRKRWRASPLPIGLVGAPADLTYDYHHLGAGTKSLAALGDHPPVAAERPMFILGQGALTGAGGAETLALAAKLALSLGVVKSGWNGFNVLHTAAARVGGLDIGFVPGAGGMGTQAIVAAAGKGDLDIVFLLGADEVDMTAFGDAMIVYLGTHGDAGAHRADVILPGAAYTEKSGIYVNTEGRPQLANRAAFPPGEARDDWSILRALSARLGDPIPYDSLADLRAGLFEAHPHLSMIGTVEPADAGALQALADMAPVAATERAIASPIQDFYLTNPIARASAIMAECSALRQLAPAEAAE